MLSYSLALLVIFLKEMSDQVFQGGYGAYKNSKFSRLDKYL
ncbi:MAG: hypothetical protein AAFO69_05655 [Bacteroidota bacterium]